MGNYHKIKKITLKIYFFCLCWCCAGVVAVAVIGYY